MITYQILYIDQYWLQHYRILSLRTQCCDYLSNFVHWSILITAIVYFHVWKRWLWLPIKFCTLINTDYSQDLQTYDRASVVITYQILYIDQYWLQQDMSVEIWDFSCDYLSNFVHWSILITALNARQKGIRWLWLPIKFCTLINTDYSR